MKRFFVTICAVVAMTMVQAQQVSDMLRFSQIDFSLGTARTAAMGGAFVSLGADLSSSAINPAGLSMYTKDDFNITPSFMFSRQNSDYQNGEVTNSSFDNRNRLLFNNLGMAWVFPNKIRTRHNSLWASTLAINMNRTIDHNSRMRVNGYSPVSLSEIFAMELTGVKKDAISGSNDAYRSFYNLKSSLWPAILAYQSYFVDPDENVDGNYYGGIENAVSQTMSQLTKGGTFETSVAYSLNFDNKLYVGASLAAVNMDYRSRNTYSEFNTDGQSTSDITSMALHEYLDMEGSGFNFKVGAIYRPIPEWRFGISYHSPSFIHMEESYVMRMQTSFNNGAWCDNDTPVSVNEYDIQTPSRLLMGTSFTIDRSVILSADYERVWYNKMSMSHDYYDLKNEIYNEIIEMGINATNNYRIGGEAFLTRNISLRMGYAFYDSMFSGDSKELQKENISFGMGYRDRDFYIDFAYIYSETRSSILMYKQQSALGSAVNKLMKNYITISIGSRF